MTGDDQPADDPVPGQDPELWGQDLFVHIDQPADWCTVRQAQEHKNQGLKAVSLLEQIARGVMIRQIYTQDEAKQLLRALQEGNQRERE